MCVCVCGYEVMWGNPETELRTSINLNLVAIEK